MKNEIEKIWERSSNNEVLNSSEKSKILECIKLLDAGTLRIAEKIDGMWKTHEWLKKLVLLYFKISENAVIDIGNKYYDKIPLKTDAWALEDFKAAGFRSVPGAIVRYGSFVSKGCVLMPSFINIGAYIGAGTLIDTWATVGSCAQIGSNCHISGGAGIGGVLEPIQANPVIIEDNVFIGARSEIAEGVVVSEGAVISMGVFLGASTRIYDRESGDIYYGNVPPYSVVVPGSMPGSDGKTHTYAAIIVKKVDEKTRSKVEINDILREM